MGKGYALRFLLENIFKNFGEYAYDGFFVFDADNILDENFISEMNNVFDNGCKVVTSYRNSKNFGDNWISAGYSIFFLREATQLNRARMMVRHQQLQFPAPAFCSAARLHAKTVVGSISC